MSEIKSTDCSDCRYHEEKISCNNLDKRLTIIRGADKENIVLCDGKKKLEAT